MQHKTAYLWGLIGKFGPQGIYLTTTMILARFLTPEDFGMIGVLSIIFVVANVLLDSGLGGSLIKEKDISKIDCSSITVFNVCVSSLIYVVLFFSADFIESLYDIGGLGNILISLSLVFPITAFGIVPKALLQRDIKFNKICQNQITGVTAGAIVAIAVGYFGGGAYALVLYQIVTNLVTVTSNFISSKYKLSFAFSISSLRRLLPFGIYTSIISIIDTVYENLMTSLIGKFMNVQQAGYMYQAKRLEETLSSSIAGTIGVVTYPILTIMKDDKEAFIKESMSTFKIITSLAFPILMTVAIFSDEIIILLFGDKWLPAGFYLRTLTFAGMLIVMETLMRNFIKALTEVKKLMVATLAKRILGIVILIAAMMIKNEYIVYGYIVSAFLGFAINTVLFKYLTKLNMSLLIKNSSLSILFSLLYFLIFTFFTHYMPIYYLISLSIIIMAIYYLVLLPTQGINLLGFIVKKR